MKEETKEEIYSIVMKALSDFFSKKDNMREHKSFDKDRLYSEIGSAVLKEFSSEKNVVNNTNYHSMKSEGYNDYLSDEQLREIFKIKDI